MSFLLSLAAVRGAVGAPGTGIQGTAHDFTNRADQAVGLCTFCHTPHKAQTTALLWNHKFSSNVYSWQDQTTTQAGTPLPTFDKTWGGPSPKCLSCHDGSVAIGDLAWFDARPWPGGVGMSTDTHGQGDKVNVGWAGNMSGNHPVVVPYPGAGTHTYFGGNRTGAAAVLQEWEPNPTANGIILFRDLGNGGVARVTANPGSGDNLGIECASCHDPHNKLSQDKYFLRGKLSGTVDYICTKCHRK